MNNQTSEEKINNSSLLLGIAALTVTSILGGTSYSIAKKIMEYFSPSELMTYRLFLGTLTLIVIRPSALGELNSAKFRLALPSAAALSLSMLFLWQGVKYSDTGLSAFLANSEFLLIPILSYLFFKQKTSLKTGSLVALGLLGMGFLCLERGFNISFGTIFLLASATCFACYALINTNLTRKIKPYELTLLNLSISTVFCAVAGIFQGFSFNFAPSTILPLLFLGPVMMGIRFYFITFGQSKVRASHAGLIYLCEPVTASLIGCFFLGETFSNFQIVGIFILIATVIGSFVIAKEESYKSRFE